VSSVKSDGLKVEAGGGVTDKGGGGGVHVSFVLMLHPVNIRLRKLSVAVLDRDRTGTHWQPKVMYVMDKLQRELVADDSHCWQPGSKLR
jgi:hypothetical protein